MVIVAIVILLGLLLPALRTGCGSRLARDSLQIRQVHQGLVVAGADRNGRFPLPGESVLRDGSGGDAGFDESANDHANLYGLLIAQGYTTPQILVSPLETSGKVSVCCNYDMKRINPAIGRRWDDSPTGFKVDLAVQSNTSYSTMPLDPTARRRGQWLNSGDSGFALLGDRGPRGGATTGSDYTKSETLKIHPGHAGWSGSICFNDNHTVLLEEMTPSRLRPLAQPLCPGAPTGSRDNLFRNDTGCAGSADKVVDSWLIVQVRSANAKADGQETISTWDGAGFASWD